MQVWEFTFAIPVSSKPFLGTSVADAEFVFVKFEATLVLFSFASDLSEAGAFLHQIQGLSS